jgi:glutathione S-transferase
MKLITSPTSPFARKVLVVAHEHGLIDRIEMIPAAMTPVAPSEIVNQVNPLGKLPAFLLADGTALYDSRVIAEYLDDLGGSGLFPAAGPARFRALTVAAAADGALDALITVRYELAVRPAEYRYQAWIDGQLAKMTRTLVVLEAEAAGFGQIGIGEIGVGCLLGYLDFRFPEIDWRGSHPGLGAFYERISQRPSMRATQPPAA